MRTPKKESKLRTVEEARDWQAAAGKWWRFTGYEIRDGYIRPAPDAQLETYDPWEAYQRTKRRGKEVLPPYARFVNLAVYLMSHDLTEARRHIADWCATFGLPGTLLHQVRTVTLAPRWLSITRDEQLLVPTQEQFVRTSTGWATRRTRFQAMDLAQAKTLDLDGSLVAHASAPEAWSRVGVLRHPLKSAEVVQETLRETWARFFPDVPAEEAETHAYPMPLSEEFWRAYAEPYGTFLDALQCIREALWDLEHHRPQRKHQPSDFKLVWDGKRLLDHLLAPASAAIVPQPDGTFTQEWVCGSLLSAFAMMALQDLTEKRRVRRCDACQRLYVSQHPGALYCSSLCRWKVQKRRQRKLESAGKTASRRSQKNEKTL